jgi:hypothetical protein
MAKIIAAVCVMWLVLTTALFPQAGGKNTTWIVPITFSNPGAPSYADTFGVGIGYSACIDYSKALPYAEVEQPPAAPPGNTDARFYDFSSTDPDAECHGMGLKTEIHAGSFLRSCTDTFQYQIQVANKSNPWTITWDTASIHQKLTSLVIRDAATGTIVNINMLTTNSVTFTSSSAAKNITQFYIYATWKPIEPVFCKGCSASMVFPNPGKLDFGRVAIGHHKDRTLTLWNTGNSTLTISALSSTSFLFTVSGSTRTIAKRDSANYTITYTPEAEGLYSGILIITSNSPDSPDSVELAGGIVAGIGDRAGLPGSIALRQNYPNPFNPGTLIRYDLPSKEFVSLKVYNMLGQEVAVLVNGVQEPGYQSVRFETAAAARGLPSGVYIYRLVAGKFSESKKMLLLR